MTAFKNKFYLWEIWGRQREILKEISKLMIKYTSMYIPYFESLNFVVFVTVLVLDRLNLLP